MMRNWQADWDRLNEMLDMEESFDLPEFAAQALPYWLTAYRELYERTIDELSRVELEKAKLERDLAITQEQWEGLKAMYVSMYEKAGKVISAAKDTCEELWGHGLIAIEALQKALDDLEGGGA
jgi:hypothetical protein